MKLFLVGYMGCGKSTVAREVAQILNLPLYDTDELIEKEQNNSISKIFASHGERHFRIIERKVLKEIIDNYPPGVFSTGGGLPCFENNMELMNEAGITVFLNCGVDLLKERLLHSKNRPLIQGKSKSELRNFIKSHLSQRKLYYNQAKIHVMGYNKPIEIALLIISKMNQL